MMDQLKGQSGKILLAGLAGITAGLIAGLLMAPEAGKDTRQGFSKSALDLGKYVRKALNKDINTGQGKKGDKKKNKVSHNPS